MLKWFGNNTTISDSEAENKLLSENWHIHSKCVDLDKIKLDLISIKFYAETQAALEYLCPETEIDYLFTKPDLMLSERAKKQIRKGIPIKYTKDFILKLYNIDINTTKENYKTRFISIFKNRDPKNIGEHVPYLSEYDTLNENLEKHYLNQTGLISVKELLWMVYSVVPNIEYCPMLIKLISVLLIFLDQFETFACLKQIIIKDYQDKELNLLKFNLRFDFDANKRVVATFIDTFKSLTRNTAKNIINKFEKINFDIFTLIEDMFQNLFLGYLNFTAYHRFFMIYLKEGTKTMMRIAYAILKTFKNDIFDISNSESVIKTIKSKSFENKETNQFFELAFSFKINQNNNRFIEIKTNEHFKPKRYINFYIPTINGESTILKDEEIFNLWTIFPENLRTKDAKLIFSTVYHGFSLEKVYEKCIDSENSCFNCLVFISTKKDDLFGVIMSYPFDATKNTFYKPSIINLFSIRPNIKLYTLIKPNDHLIMCNSDKIVIGLEDNGPAIELDKDLGFGYSYPTKMFSNPALCTLDSSDSNLFEIDTVEIFILY